MKASEVNFEPRQRSELTPETLLLRQDMIMPGDVLLTHGGAKISKVIAQLDGGRFSHAAVFVSPVDLFESYDMVAHASIESVGHTIIGGKKVYLARLPRNPVQAELWRHPDAGSITWDIFKEVYAKVLEEQWGYDYPPYARLVPLARLPAFVKWLAKKWYKNRPKSPIPGDFCSELVARFYERLNLPLFDGSRATDGVSPNDLAKSKLQMVKGAILRREEIESFYPQPSEIGGGATTNPEGTDFGAANMHSNHVMAKQLDDLDQLTKEMRIHNHAAIRETVNIQKGHLLQMSAEVENRSMAWMENTVFKLWKIYEKLIQDLYITEEIPESANAKYHAAIKEWNAFGNSLLRCKTILRSRALRTAALDGSMVPKQRKKLNKLRKAILIDCRKTLRGSKANMNCAVNKLKT
jgi:hypothetical protein